MHGMVWNCCKAELCFVFSLSFGAIAHYWALLVCSDCYVAPTTRDEDCSTVKVFMVTGS